MSGVTLEERLAALEERLAAAELAATRARDRGGLLGDWKMYQPTASAAANLSSLATRRASLFGGPLMRCALQMGRATAFAGDLALLVQ